MIERLEGVFCFSVLCYIVMYSISHIADLTQVQVINMSVAVGKFCPMTTTEQIPSADEDQVIDTKAKHP